MTASTCPADILPSTATLVPDERRMDFLPTLFGLSLLMVGEHTVYHFLDQLSRTTAAGSGSSSNGTARRCICVPPPTAGSASTAAPTTMRARSRPTPPASSRRCSPFSHLSFRDRSERMANAYARLYAFAGDHPEARAIFGAID